MEKIDQFAFYEVGKVFSKILEQTGDIARINALWLLIDADSVIKRWLSGDPMPLGLSRARAVTLKEQIDSIMNSTFKEKDKNGNMKFRWPAGDDPPIDSWLWNSLKSAINNFETVLSDEMREAATYYVPRRGIFLTSALVDSAEEHFPLEIRSLIPEKTITEWKSAGRCLAFNLLAASGFHVARAVEGILESYFAAYCQEGGKKNKTWGDYLAALETKLKSGLKPSPSEKTLAEIRQMKDDYRNPIMHPRAMLHFANPVT